MPLSSTGRASDSESEGSRFETWRGNCERRTDNCRCGAFIAKLADDRNAAIIDVASFSSRSVGALLDQDYNNLALLDLSATALTPSQQRLGERAATVRSRAMHLLEPKSVAAALDVWHDPAVERCSGFDVALDSAAPLQEVFGTHRASHRSPMRSKSIATAHAPTPTGATAVDDPHWGTHE